MKIIFCNVSYMKNYIGKTEYDMPEGAGRWVKENNDAHEKWNFLNMDGNCYGFVQINGNNFSIERIEDADKTDDVVKDVLVVWCSPKNGKTVIVGWYRNATVYRQYFDLPVTIATGIDRSYFCTAKADDCFLLPECERTFEIERAAHKGMGKGFGQSNIWYADSDYGKEEIVPKIIEYISNYTGQRINKVPKSFEDDGNTTPLSADEIDIFNQYCDEQDWIKMLPLAYREFRSTNSADIAVRIGFALANLYQYHAAITWLEKGVSLEGNMWDSTSMLSCLYQQIDDFDKSTETAKLLFDMKEMNDERAKAEVFSIIADNYMFEGDYIEAINWLDNILSLSSIDEDLRSFTIKNRRRMMELLDCNNMGTV